MATDTKSISKSMKRVLDVDEKPLDTLAPIDGYENMPLVSIEAAVVPLTALVPGINDLVKRAKKRYDPKVAPAGMTIDESASITLYTMDEDKYGKSPYNTLNKTLRSKNRQDLPSWYLYLKLLFNALSRLPSTRRFVFRGIKSDLYKDYLTNKTVTWWSFSSTAMQIDGLRAFLGTTGARTMFTIDCNSGKDISLFSEYSHETEVLLLPETQLKVISCLDQGNGLCAIQLKEIQSPLFVKQPINTVDSLNTSSIGQKKLQMKCEGHACRTCNKCCDWSRDGNNWHRRNDATCKHRFNPSNHIDETCQCNE